MGRIVGQYILENEAQDPRIDERFLFEGKRQAGVQHPNIVSAVDLLQVDEHSYLPMRYVEGQSLDFRLEPGSDDPDTKALADVDRVVNAISAANVKDVYLLGFADNRGSFEKNLILSENRARVVAAKLKPQGVGEVWVPR